MQLKPIQRKGWHAAHILYVSNIAACIVGAAAAAFYGTDDLWSIVIIIVQDSMFDDAYDTLRGAGYQDLAREALDGGYCVLRAFGSDYIAWRSMYADGPNLLLAPASHWHFEITEGTTQVIDGIRLPKYSSYLQALISLLARRCEKSIPPGDFMLEALRILVLQDKYSTSLEELSLADRFFLKHFFSVRRPRNRKKVVELWNGLNAGYLSIDDAEASASSI